MHTPTIGPYTKPAYAILQNKPKHTDRKRVRLNTTYQVEIHSPESIRISAASLHTILHAALGSVIAIRVSARGMPPKTIYRMLDTTISWQRMETAFSGQGDASVFTSGVSPRICQTIKHPMNRERDQNQSCFSRCQHLEIFLS